jgi:hypothetical protein
MLCRFKVPNINFIYILGAVLKGVVPLMHCCSEAEAESLGIFFNEMFGLLNHWSKRMNWNKECADYAGFMR